MRHPRGAECQCPTCLLFFTSDSAFSAHLRPVGCQHPGEVTNRKTGERRLFEKQRKGGPTWGFPGDDRWSETKGVRL